MGKFMKFLYSFMVIVLVLLGALFLAVGISDNSYGNFFVDARFLNILISNVSFIKGFFISLGGILILFSITILVTLNQNTNRGYDVLLEDEKGSVLLSRKSLEAVMEKSINKFFEVKCQNSKAIIVENQRIEAKCMAFYFGSEDIKALSERIRAEIIKNLMDFTEITDIRLELKLEMKEIEEKRDGRY